MASGRQDRELVLPQWKKELLLRRRTLTRALSSGTVRLRVSCPTRPESVPLVQSYGKHLQPTSHPPSDFLPDRSVRTMRFLDQDLLSSELISIKCNANSDSDLKVKMVEEKPGKKPSFRSMDKSKEGKNPKAFIKDEREDEDYHSDSSEELQYGPGIVNKLKSKYLSMTLRDNQKHSARPSLSNLRRATSLENMLDDDNSRLQQKPHFIKKPYHSSTHKSSKISQHHAKYLGLTRGSDSMKRARSMDTLIKNDQKNGLNQIKNTTFATSGYTNGSITPSIINEDIIIVDNSSETIETNKQPPKVEDTELPPHDLVKQTLKLFETSANKKPEIQSKVKIAVSKIANSTVKPNNVESGPLKHKSFKPLLGPKPIITPEKKFTRPKVVSPKRLYPIVSSIEKPKPPVIAPKVCPIGTPKKFTSPVISPKVSPTTENKKMVSPVENRMVSPTKVEKIGSPIESKVFSLVENKIVSPVENKKNVSPAENKKIVSPIENKTIIPTVENKRIVPPLPFNASPLNSIQTKSTADSPITSTPVPGNLQEPCFNFKEAERLSISPVNNDSVDKDSSPIEDKPKYISQKARDGISKEGMSMKFSFNDKEIIPDKSYLPRTMPQATNTALISSQGDSTPVKQVAIIRPVVKNKVLTEQEIEKNFINKAKTIESKIVKSDDTSASEQPQLWEKKNWQSQNTMVFNFSDRKSVPDYIENDGINLTNRRTSKCNGDSVDADDGDEDWEPPLTCNVRFVGDNILINGKSNLKKEPRPSKLRIQFNDEATTTFEYPSEESMSEDVTSPSPTPSPTTTPNPLTLGGGTLSNYTPSKTQGSQKFELGVTRTAPLNHNSHETSEPSKKESKEEDEYLKPMDPDEVSPWSQETTTDMLF